MRKYRTCQAGPRCSLLLVLSCLGLITLAEQKSLPAIDPGPVVKVEEDWSLEIISPAYDETSPQITNTISPVPNLNGRFGVFELNHGTQPDYNDGGLELQIWDHNDRISYRRHGNTNRLSYCDEIVKYTLVMSLKTPDDGSRRLQFDVKNGSSQTWGVFGDNDNLRCHAWTSLANLEAYSPTFSVENSRVGYASFRVRKYALVAVRYYDANGLIRTDSTERVAFEYRANAVISEP